MKKEHAENLMIASTCVSNGVGTVMFLIEDYLEGDEKKKFRKAIATVSANLFAEIQLPIINEFPELTPVHLKNDN